MEQTVKSYDDAEAFDLLDEYVYIIDMHSYEMLFMNKMARESFSEAEGGYSGKKCYEILRHLNEPCAFCGAAGMTMANSCRWLSHNKILDEYHQVQDIPIIYKGHEARIEMSVDITAQVRQRQKLKAALDTETAMLEAIHILNESLDYPSAANKMLEFLGICFGAKRTYIYEKQGDKYIATFNWSRPGMDLKLGKGHTVSAEFVEEWLNQSKNKRSLFSDNDAEAESAKMALAEDSGIEASVAASLEMDGSTIGLIGMDDPMVERLEPVSMMMTTLAYFTVLTMASASNRHSLELLSYSDAMTKVANRNAYIRDVRRYKENFAVAPRSVGIIYLDLNELKMINDTEGHEAGDRLIISLADVIAFFFRRTEIYRVGGDEFVVIAAGITQEAFNERVRKISDFIEEQSKLSVSIGYSWSEDGTELDALIEKADGLMYSKKQNYYLKNIEK